MNWYERFREIREKNRISQAKLGRALGKDGTQISRYERGAVENFPNSLYKLMKNVFTEEEIKYIEYGSLKKTGDVVEDAGEVYNNTEDDYICVPYYKEVYASAGGGSSENSTENTSPVSLSRQFLNSFLGIHDIKGLSIINAAGDSMTPTIRSGELMFVCPLTNEGFKDGAIYVVVCGTDLYVKRVWRDPLTKEYTLSSDNKEVADVKLTLDEASDCHFVGRVVGHFDRV